MSHEIAETADGRASIAYTGQTPWHGLGQQLTPGAPLETWQHEAGLDWEAKRSVVGYGRELIGVDGKTTYESLQSPNHHVLYRSDTGKPLSIVSDRYKVVQPGQIVNFYRDLVERHGFEIETAGALKDGRKVWALANTKRHAELRGGDAIKAYLLLATSYDGSMATQARFTAIRVVCNNTLTFAVEGSRPDVSVPHNATFDADKIKLDLQIGDAWDQFQSQSQAMSERIVGQDEAVQFFLKVYHDLCSVEQIREAHADPAVAARHEAFMEKRMTTALFNSPGAHLASAKGMLWGLVNAVTWDVDHSAPARSTDNRLNSAWFGKGEIIKRRAWQAALEML